MLNQSAINSAYSLADQLDAGGVVLQPLAGSPLHHLVASTCAPSTAAYRMDDGNVMIDPYAISEASNTIVGPFERARHDLALDEIRQTASRSVQAQLSLIRNRVTPMINTLVQQVTMRLQSTKASELANIEVVTNESGAALHNPALNSLIEKFELIAPMEPMLNTALPRLTAAEIMPLLETGIATLDKDVAEWVASIGTNEIECIWDCFFSAQTPRETGANATIRNTSTAFSALVGEWESARLVVFLLARHMLENDVVIEGTEMNLTAMRETFKNYQEQAGRLLNRQLEQNAIAVRNGVLVLSMSSTMIKVNTPVYDAWLANGGDNDILYGMAVSGKPAYTVSSITDKAEAYREGWVKYMAMIQSADSNRRFNYLCDQLVLCYEAMVAEEEIDGAKLDARGVHKVMASFTQELNAMSILDTKDLYSLCMKLVCRSRFAGTTAERFLSKMDEVSKMSPTLPPREVANVAMIDYITDWVASQFVVVAI